MQDDIERLKVLLSVQQLGGMRFACCSILQPNLAKAALSLIMFS